MNDTNSVVLVGRLGRDAELKYTDGGTAVVRFSTCVNGSKKQGDSYTDVPNWFDVTYFGKGAEAVNQFLIKGKQVAVLGELKQDKWDKDGETRTKVYVVAHSVQLLGSKEGGGGGERRPSEKAARQTATAGSEPGDDFTDDIPF
jgi:single-strand DNA-binding protein